ncbi:MAG: rhodanese-like domain-containing protein [Holophagaceae bacterium]|nr:rhodanese-like domain-containing protein [Holophagaceae bacterium]
MKPILALGLCALLRAGEPGPPNPAIDMEGYLARSVEAAKLRSTRRLTEAEFIRMSREPGTIVLDARSANKFAELHVQGAVNLPFTDFTARSLAKVLPAKGTRVLIYCNNNFKNSERAFPGKSASAALNLSTFQSLLSYGYGNVYELGPLVDPKASALAFEGTLLGPDRPRDTRPEAPQGAEVTNLSR